MNFLGNINLLNNEMQQMVMDIEIDFPITPEVGRVVFKDNNLYICANILNNIPAWIPLGNLPNTYIHDQTTASTTWTINHNLNVVTPLIQLYDTNYTLIVPNSVTPVDNNTTTVTLSFAMKGRAILMSGDLGDQERLTQITPEIYAFTFTQSTANNIWVINHGLGYYPIVRVFDNTNTELQPLKIEHDSIFQTTIFFTNATSGTARLA